MSSIQTESPHPTPSPQPSQISFSNHLLAFPFEVSWLVTSCTFTLMFIKCVLIHLMDKPHFIKYLLVRYWALNCAKQPVCTEDKEVVELDCAPWKGHCALNERLLCQECTSLVRRRAQETRHRRAPIPSPGDLTDKMTNERQDDIKTAYINESINRHRFRQHKSESAEETHTQELGKVQKGGCSGGESHG